MEHIERESMEFDVVIVGAGPAGFLLRLKFVNLQLKTTLMICPFVS